MRELDRFLQEGYLKKRPPNFNQIHKQITGAWRDLNTAKRIAEEDPQWSQTISYHAILRAGRALLHTIGYLPADGGQHKTVVSTAGIILGAAFDSLIAKFDRLRRKRNVFIYDVDEGGSLTETKNAIETAEQLLRAINNKIDELSPQGRLGLK